MSVLKATSVDIEVFLLNGTVYHLKVSSIISILIEYP